MSKSVVLRVETFSCLIAEGSKDQKAKRTKKCFIKRKLKFENYENCLNNNSTQEQINHLEKNKIDIDSIKKNHEKVIRNNKVLQTQQRFKSERQNVFTKEINKITLGSNDDKIMQSTYSIETQAYGTSKALVREKEDIKCNYIIKRYKDG